jgi:hypothetical protein
MSMHGSPGPQGMTGNHGPAVSKNWSPARKYMQKIDNTS